MSRLKIYNTLTRSLEEFMPLDKEHVRVYSCGPTVYHYQHVGNMRSYVFADLLQKTLLTLYPAITHVINITDVGHLVSDADTGEDKMEKGAKREGKSAYDIAEYYTKSFMSDLRKLNIDVDDYVFPRATDFIKEQVAFVEKLERKSYTYKTADGVYFDTSKFSSYSEFAKLNIENLNAGERVEMGDKKNKTDFALWKFSPATEKREMEWESPWGLGFPGWHIECSAMSEALLGKTFDIHTGGIDHIPVHHTNEIAQSTCLHDGDKDYIRPVNYWMHNNFLLDKTGKMSKSNDDFLRLETLIEKGYNPAAFRYLLLTTNYRSELAFSFESLDAASNAFNKLVRYMHEAAKIKENIVDATKYRINQEYYDKFLECMYNDLATSSALAVVWEMINIKAEHTYSTILAMNRVLGLDLTYSEGVLNLTDEEKDKVTELTERRKLARADKDWTTSDALREELKAIGVEVVD